MPRHPLADQAVQDEPVADHCDRGDERRDTPRNPFQRDGKQPNSYVNGLAKSLACLMLHEGMKDEG